ncbi:hypothetical protein [Streptomyces sp. GQFP]|uniref:hypothetical protein n=1 Tax=Streptomyces sp. GQFP TaxID=2907545 RepID=UPI001F3A885C|nr:hypothetical protein [Streptomyces sp. GQFP]UIX31628.1 hypothetical protein LUX31_17150 [Streptomyces sp. GQFP]
MKRFGFYREHFSVPTELPSIHDIPLSLDSVIEDILGYLEGNPTAVDYTEASDCLLGCGALLVGCSSVKTDGEWVWRHDTHHYVSEHGLSVPPEFMTWGEDRRWVVVRGEWENVEIFDEALAVSRSLE